MHQITVCKRSSWTTYIIFIGHLGHVGGMLFPDTTQAGCNGMGILPQHQDIQVRYDLAAPVRHNTMHLHQETRNNYWSKLAVKQWPVEKSPGICQENERRKEDLREGRQARM